jgi:hypothetical protein
MGTMKNKRKTEEDAERTQRRAMKKREEEEKSLFIFADSHVPRSA